jgi:putative hydrolase of the HAD superfamily
MSLQKIQAVIFDLDDTLHDSSGMADTARRAVATAIYSEGILPAKSPEEIYEVYLEIVKKYGSNYNHHFSALCEHYGVKPDPRVIAAGKVAYHNTKFAMLHLLPQVQETLIWLVKNNLKLAIVSNGIEDKQWEKIIRLKIRPFFNYIETSENQEIGANKEGMILNTLKNLEVSPENTIFVGDRGNTDICSANHCGLISILIKNGKYKNELPNGEDCIPKYTINEIPELMDIIRKENE